MTYFCDYAEIVCHYPIKQTVFSNVSSFHAMSWITFAVSNRNRKWESLFYVPLTLHSWTMCTNSAIWTITSCCYHSWPTARHITYLHIRTKQKNTKGSLRNFPLKFGAIFHIWTNQLHYHQLHEYSYYVCSDYKMNFRSICSHVVC